MKITHRYTQTDTVLLESEDGEIAAAQQYDDATLQRALGILTTNLGLRAHEKLLIVTDTPLLSVAASWFVAGQQITDQAELIQLDKVETSGQEPPAAVAAAIAEYDVVLLHTSRSLTHTSAGDAIRQHARGASLPGVTQDILDHTMNTPYDSISQRGRALQMVVQSAQHMRITSEHGTDLIAGVRQDGVFNDDGIYLEPGAYGNLPAGEVFFAPLPDTTEGTWVINAMLADHELDEDIVLEIQHGSVTRISGGRAAGELEATLSEFGDPAFVVAEIGIGTHPAARPTAPVIESEKALGTAHLAVGNSAVIGGDNDVPIHLDGITLDPTIEVDQALVMREGSFEIAAGFGT